MIYKISNVLKKKLTSILDPVKTKLIDTDQKFW